MLIDFLLFFFAESNDFLKKQLIFCFKDVIITKVRFEQAEIAQLVEHFTRNEGVVSSSLIFGFPLQKGGCPELSGQPPFVIFFQASALRLK